MIFPLLAFPIALLVAQGPAANGPTAPPAAPLAADLRPLDEVVQIVNEEMLTSRTFIRAMYMENQGKSFTSEEQKRQSQQRVSENTVKYALRIQAGQDMGLDPAAVERDAKSWIEEQRERNGSESFAKMLQASQMTLYEYQELIRDRLYSTFWENYVTGRGSVGQGARPSRDRYVRPGLMSYRYQQCIEHPQLLPEIGGRDQSVVVQQLILDPKESGGLDGARTLAGDLRRRILAGEDMSELVDRYSVLKTNHGISDPHPEAVIAKADPGLGAFIAEGKSGDVSEPQDFTAKGRTGVRIVRIVDRLSPLVPELTSVDVQKKLGEVERKELGDWRLDQAYKVLYRSSYVWVPSENER